MKTLSTSHAVRALNNATANRLTTVAAQTDELDCEANLTFDGSTLALTGDQTISGNLTVSGTTTSVQTTNTVIKDQLIELGNGRTGSASGDAGLIVERGSDTNAALLYDESEDAWKACTTAATGASTGDLTLTDAPFKAAAITSSGTVTAVALDISGDVDVDGSLEADAITLNGDALSTIFSPIAGSSSIVTVGTIATGVWQGTAIGNAYVADLPTSKITSGTFADGRIAASNVTQHQASITGVGTISSGVWQGTAIANAYVADLPTSKITSGTFADARIAASNVTQHQASITATGALDSGSITSGFGAINNGSSSITCGAITASGVVDVTDTTDATGDDGDSGALRCEGGASIAKKLFVGTDLSVNGTANLDAVDIDGAVQLDSTLTVGADDTGYNVILYGATASANLTWQASSDDLIFNGAAACVIPEGQLVLGSTAVTASAAELNLLDGVSGLVQADLTKLAAVDSTAAELNLLNGVSGLVQADLTKLAAVDATAAEIDLLDGDTSVGGSITIADTDGFIVNDGGTMKTIPASDIKTYAGGGGGSAADDSNLVLHMQVFA